MRPMLLVGVFVLFTTVVNATAGPLMLSVQPTASTYSSGDLFSVNVEISDVASLISWQFDLGFDPTILRATAVTWGPFLETAGSTIGSLGTIDNTAGSIDALADVLISGSVSGSGTLASIEFEAIGAGTSVLSLSNPFIFDENFVGLRPTLQGAAVTVGAAAVPEPPLALPVAALIAIGLWRRKVAAANASC